MPKDTNMTKPFKYETPPWGAKLICLVYFLVSSLLLLAYATYSSWAENAPSALQYVFLIVGIAFLFVSLKPATWKGWVYFTADDNGLYFPTKLTKANQQPHLNVPWSNVGIIQVEALYGAVNGVSIELNISKYDLDLYFGDSGQTNKILGFNQKRGDYYVIAYANNTFQKLSDVVHTLNKLKSANLKT